MEIRKTKQELIGENRARKVINELVTASQWFEVTPYPCDLWIITVKFENEGMLRRLIADSGPLESKDVEVEEAAEGEEAVEARQEARTVP